MKYNQTTFTILFIAFSFSLFSQNECEKIFKQYESQSLTPEFKRTSRTIDDDEMVYNMNEFDLQRGISHHKSYYKDSAFHREKNLAVYNESIFRKGEHYQRKDFGEWTLTKQDTTQKYEPLDTSYFKGFKKFYKRFEGCKIDGQEMINNVLCQKITYKSYGYVNAPPDSVAQDCINWYAVDNKRLMKTQSIRITKKGVLNKKTYEFSPKATVTTTEYEVKVDVEIPKEYRIKVDTVSRKPKLFSYSTLGFTGDSLYRYDVNPTGFKDGLWGLIKYMRKELMYPEIARQKKIEGFVWLDFVITKEGKMMDVEIEKGLDESCNAEALRLVKSTSNCWEIGKLNDGTPVHVKHSVSISFVIEDE